MPSDSTLRRINWAVQQSGFDPSTPGAPPHLRVQAAAGPPPGAGVAAGAVTGAAFGDAVSQPWERGEGAALGAVAGAIVGGIAESTATEQLRAQSMANARSAQAARLEQQARSYPTIATILTTVIPCTGLHQEDPASSMAATGAGIGSTAAIGTVGETAHG
jgi:hypothetical protein